MRFSITFNSIIVYSSVTQLKIPFKWLNDCHRPHSRLIISSSSISRYLTAFNTTFLSFQFNRHHFNTAIIVGYPSKWSFSILTQLDENKNAIWRADNNFSVKEKETYRTHLAVCGCKMSIWAASHVNQLLKPRIQLKERTTS